MRVRPADVIAGVTIFGLLGAWVRDEWRRRVRHRRDD